MGEKVTSTRVIHEFERTYLEKLRLAAQVILEAAPDLSFFSDPLEVELGIFKDRLEFELLLPAPAADALSWSDELGRKNTPLA